MNSLTLQWTKWPDLSPSKARKQAFLPDPHKGAGSQGFGPFMRILANAAYFMHYLVK